MVNFGENFNLGIKLITVRLRHWGLRSLSTTLYWALSMVSFYFLFCIYQNNHISLSVYQCSESHKFLELLNSYSSLLFALHTHTHTHTRVWVCVCVCVLTLDCKLLIKKKPSFSYCKGPMIFVKIIKLDERPLWPVWSGTQCILLD